MGISCLPSPKCWINFANGTYDAIEVPEVTVINADNDTTSVSLNKTDLATSEDGKADSFSVVLDSQPENRVNIAFENTDNTEGAIAPDNLIFTPDNWETPQTVTVTGVDDSKADGNIDWKILATATSNDEN